MHKITVIVCRDDMANKMKNVFCTSMQVTFFKMKNLLSRT